MGMFSLEGRVQAPGMTAMDRVARRFVLAALNRFPERALTILEPDGRRLVAGQGEPSAQLRMLDWRTYRMMMSGGALGAAEAYMNQLWDSDDLTAVVQFFAANIQHMHSLETGGARLLRPLRQLLHFFNRNSLTGSRRNIAAHYDLGNDFFSLFLDPTMMYSAAVWPHQDASLEEASVHKLDLICRKLELKPGMTLLEIGTGWGGLAVHAAREYGCQVVTTTISAEQFQYATARVRAAGLDDRVTVLDQDYRLLEGQYDRVVSIEMIEAVGHQYLGTYFEKLNRLLKPDGLLLLQAITVPDQRYDYAIRNVDFIKRYVFPGGFLPSLAVMHQHLARDTSLTAIDVQDIGIDYARTLACWHEAFVSRMDEVLAQGFDDYFCRMWRYYLSYCEGAFRERAISTVQVVAAGTHWRPQLQSL